MRYGIFSDVHSNLEALGAAINALHQEDIGRYLCIGDVVGYASNPNECVEKVKTLAPITVAGNHDWACVNLFSEEYFNPVAREAVIWTRSNLDDTTKYFLGSLRLTYENQDLALAHGTLHNPQDFEYMLDEDAAAATFALLKTNICFVGHTHRPGVFIQNFLGEIHYKESGAIEIKGGDKYVVDVGSVGQPRDGDPRAAYCIYDTEKKEVQIKRVSYDIQTARSKIINAGLPRYLGDRLLAGR